MPSARHRVGARKEHRRYLESRRQRDICWTVHFSSWIIQQRHSARQCFSCAFSEKGSCLCQLSTAWPGAERLGHRNPARQQASPRLPAQVHDSCNMHLCLINKQANHCACHVACCSILHQLTPCSDFNLTSTLHSHKYTQTNHLIVHEPSLC